MIVCDGKVFESQKAFARYIQYNYKINLGTTKGRLQKGWSPEECKKPLQNVKSIICDGIKFESHTAFAKWIQINYGIGIVATVGRLKLGWLPEDCKKATIQNVKSIICDGIEFESHTEFGKWIQINYGIKLKTTKGRLDQGWLPEECKKPLLIQNKISIVCDGKVFESKATFAFYIQEKYGINVNTIIGRLNQGWLPEECKKPLQSEKKSIVCDGIKFESSIVFAKYIQEKYDIPIGTTYQRLNRGVLPEECKKPSGVNLKPIVCDGIDFKSKSAFVKWIQEKYGINEGLTYGRLQLGWLPEECKKSLLKEKISIVCDGIKFESKKAFAMWIQENYGIDVGTTSSRLFKGWVPEECKKPIQHIVQLNFFYKEFICSNCLRQLPKGKLSFVFNESMTVCQECVKDLKVTGLKYCASCGQLKRINSEIVSSLKICNSCKK